MFVITGVSGNTGSVVASALLAAKQPVRVIVRDAAKGAEWSARGAEVAVADLTDRAAVTAALRGAAGVYVLLPPPPWTGTGLDADRARKTEAIAGAVADAKPGHVVMLSSAGAQHAAGTGPIASLHRLEGALAKTGVPITFLRAGAFMENWGAMLKGAIAAGALYYGIPPAYPFQQVAAEDIGKTAARLLVDGAPKAGNRIVQVTGPAEVSVAEVAAALSAISGKTIAAVHVPTSAVVQAMMGMGASKETADGMGEMLDGANAGLLAWTEPEVVRGSITIEHWLRAALGK